MNDTITRDQLAALLRALHRNGLGALDVFARQVENQAPGHVFESQLLHVRDAAEIARATLGGDHDLTIEFADHMESLTCEDCGSLCSNVGPFNEKERVCGPCKGKAWASGDGPEKLAREFAGLGVSVEFVGGAER